MDELLDLPALDQSARVRRGDVSVEALVRAHLARVEARDGAVRAFVLRAPERAIARARALDRERSRVGASALGPLWGVPTAMKDLHLTAGMFARLGSRAFRYLWSPLDDVSSASVRRAGMVITGKLSTSELAILPFVDTDLHEPTVNPWDPGRYSGGSSGGSSAAIAAGLMSVAVASDGAGSIRIPAAFCGLFGHKPTRGVVPNPFAPFEPLGLSVIGPHARTVDDAAALLDVLAPDGPPHPRGRAAAHSSRAHRGPNRGAWLASVARPPTGLRVRVTTDNPVVSSSEPVIAAVQRVIRALEELGHQVEPGVRFEGQVEEFLPMFRFLARGMFVPREASLQASTRHLRDDRGGRVTLARALEARELFRARIDRWFEGCDVYVTPTVAMLPPRVGQFDLSDGEAVFREAAPYGAFTAAFNASGHPAATVPVRVEGCPLPLGVQLVGARGDDATLLALARALLEALGTPVLPTAPAR